MFQTNAFANFAMNCNECSGAASGAALRSSVARSEASTVDIIVNLVSTTEVLNQVMLVSWLRDSMGFHGIPKI